jgi:hypothetical protein
VGLCVCMGGRERERESQSSGEGKEVTSSSKARPQRVIYTYTYLHLQLRFKCARACVSANLLWCGVQNEEEEERVGSVFIGAPLERRLVFWYPLSTLHKCPLKVEKGVPGVKGHAEGKQAG